jgi:signal transduction histidine kinase
MRERIRHLKGEMNIESGETGTKICVTLPMIEGGNGQARS